LKIDQVINLFRSFFERGKDGDDHREGTGKNSSLVPPGWAIDFGDSASLWLESEHRQALAA
jgi:hypothetical protein